MPITGSQKAPTISRLNIKRLGGSRLGYAQPIFRASIGGAWRDASNIRLDGISITDELDGTPNTATLRVQGFVPLAGQEVALYLGDTMRVIFRGTILRCVQVYDGQPSHLSYDLSCISHEWRLNQYKVTERYLSQSATAIVLDLCATYAPWVDTSGVERELPSLTEITFTNEDLTTCLDRLKDRREVGGRWVLDYGDQLHFGTTIAPGSSPIHPITDDAYHGLIAIAASTDFSQVRTRVLVEGGGSQCLAELAPGETLVPVEDAVWYDVTLGGTVVSGPQRITYTGVVGGGAGALVGTTARPSNGPTVTPTGGTGVSSGPHSYAVVFVSATGKTLPSPETTAVFGTASVTPPTTGGDSGVLTDPSTTLVAPPSATGSASTYPGASGTAGYLDAGARYDYQYTFYETATGKQTTPSPAFGATLTPSSQNVMLINGASLQAAPAGCARRWYRTEGNASPKVYHLRTTSGDPPASGTYPGSFFDDFPDASLNTSVHPPTTNTLTANPGNLDANARYNYQYTFYETATGKETTPSPAFGSTLDSGKQSMLILQSMIQAPPAGLIRRWYRTQGNPPAPSTYYLLATGDLAASAGYPAYFEDRAADATLNLSIQPPTTSTFVANAAALSAIATGPTGTTAREIYRTAAYASQLKLLATLANNTATTYTDTLADASLGANAPITDTSGLVSEAGTIAPGAAAIRVTGLTPFRAAGGWAAAGGQVVRYTGLSGTSLTGIPATGSGALDGPLNYGSEIVALPLLTGIPVSGTGAILCAIAKGDEINLFVTRTDVTAQGVLAALLSTATQPHDGIIEDYIQDRRLSKTEAEARGDARLAEVKDPEVHITYQTRDQTTRSGRDVTITLTAPAISGTFTVQRVVISQFDPLGRIGPVRAVEASSRRFSLEQLLRLVKGV